MNVICFDLDDTLYKEIDFLKSAYREIAFCAAQGDRMLADQAYAEMLQVYKDGGNAFRRLNEMLGLTTPVVDYLAMYRAHRPDIRLDEEVRKTLDALKAAGCAIGLITDGRSVQQRNKIAALGLNRWIEEGDIIISEEIGSEKPAEANYRRVMERHPEAERFVYVGDNPAKDFIAPNRLGWETICILDNGENIHPQTFSKAEPQNQPLYKVKSLADVEKHVFSWHKRVINASFVMQERKK